MSAKPHARPAAKPQQRLHNWPQQLGRRLLRQGRSIVFLKEALYPVLCVNVHLLERARERIGEIDATLLGLLGLGIGTSEGLSYWSGLPAHRIAPLLSELVLRGLVDPAGGRYALAELGRITREHGHLTTLSCRALLLCGISGRLLPAGAYGLARLSFADVRSNRYLPPVFVAESSRLPLSHLSLARIPDRRAVNLPDEVVEIKGVEAATAEPGFLQGLAVLTVTAEGEHVAEFHLPCADGVLAGLSAEQLVGLVEPLGFCADPVYDKATGRSGPRTPEMALAEICRSLVGDDSPPRARLDAYGNPRLIFDAASDALLNSRLGDERLVAHLATSTTTGMLVHKLMGNGASRRELLRGRTLSLVAAPNSTLERRVDAVKTALELDTRLRRRQGDSATGNASARQQLAAMDEAARAQIEAIAASFRLKHLQAALRTAVSEVEEPEAEQPAAAESEVVESELDEPEADDLEADEDVVEEEAE